jgi:SAM-dependent methyltransferase/uncharacterized protein YbaR (Trm112 family)
MRHDLLARLRCPGCAAERRLTLAGPRSNDHEVRQGTVVCCDCGAQFPINDGIVELLVEPPEHVTREAAGLARFAEVMRADGWDCSRIRALPYVDLPYWWGQRRAFEYWVDQLPFRAGEWLLDIGSNTCWASALFAQLGLAVIALDITTIELQGLRSAECFIADGSLYFERVLSTMAAPAIASESMDYVFCCEALHHNDREALSQTLRECYRVLRPGGSLLVVNEPLRFPLRLKRRHADEVAQFEGNEHVYFLHQYALAARRAGFQLSVRWPRNAPRPARDAPAPGAPSSRKPRVVRRAYATWKLAVAGDAALNMVCRKPLAG